MRNPLRQALVDALEKSGKSLSQVAAECGVDKGNLSRFLNGKGRSALIGVSRLEKLIDGLGVSVIPPKYPPHLSWLYELDRWYEILRGSVRGVSDEDLHQILIHVIKPVEQRLHFLRKNGPGYVF